MSGDSPIRLDLRSDTVTRPTTAMRRAMAEAPVGDDVFREDPTVIRLEAQVAELLGLEAGLFVASGTMANQVAVAAHTVPGDEVICHRDSHLVHYERGGASALSGVSFWLLDDPRGDLAPDQVKAALRPRNNPIGPCTGLIWLENTHNRCGGRILQPRLVEETCRVAREAGIPVHLDGARLLNAAVATDREPRELTAGLDSASICLSKGLGAPVGSVLAGRADWIERARGFRRRLGGDMRQVGVLAACGLHALDQHLPDLAEDHRRARWMAEELAGRSGLQVDLETVETNILLVDLPSGGWDADRWIAEAARAGLGIVAFGPYRLRLTTHRDLDDRQVEEAVEVMIRLAGQAGG